MRFTNDVYTNGYEWTYFLHFLLPDLEQEAYYEAIGGTMAAIQNEPLL